MKRRGFLTSVGATAASVIAMSRASMASASDDVGAFEVTRTEEEWREMLSDIQYYVMREEGTERAFTSPLDKHYEAGTYICQGCDLPLYSSETKFDSGTGWPSFYQALDNAIGTKDDATFWGVYTECHCRRCGSHLGHIFDDGPKPTGKRHCINGVCLKFVEAETEAEPETEAS